jgi:glutaminase
VVSEAVVRQVLSVMTTCGMYDAAGDWVTQVGIPAKSGVAGGLIGALPGQVGIATFSPRLDKHGNSVRGVRLFERFSDDMGMHMMEVPAASRTVLRKNRGIAGLRLYALQGGLRFAEAEQVVREVSDHPPTEHRVGFNLSHVHAMDGVARRMLLEVIRRLSLDGHDVYLIDPDRVIKAPDPGDGGRVTVVADIDDIA